MVTVTRVVRRIVTSAIVLVVVATASFVLLHAAPGGPFATDARRSPAVARALEQRYGTGDSLASQYVSELAHLARGDLGQSLVRDESVADVIASRFPVSALIGALALALALALGVASGVAAAARGGWVDRAVRAGAVLALCVPAFVAGPLLIAWLSLRLGWFPPARLDSASAYVLPAVTLALVYAGALARLARAGMCDALGEDFVRTARAKGASERAVVWRHALRAGIAPAVSYVGPAAAAMLAGSFVVEKVFQVPGLGSSVVEAIAQRDYPVLTGVLVFYAALVVALDLVVDGALAWLDPRSRR
nr:ABC transporter permease [Kofleriaceae bacterium]